VTPDDVLAWFFTRLTFKPRFVLVNKAAKIRPGDTVAYPYDDYPQVGKLFSSGIITQDGETIDGGGLDTLIVLGKITATILCV